MKNVSLVLSGGGARGYAHVGVIKVLTQNGFNITSIAGTSMGALVGGIYAAGGLSSFEQWVLSLDVKEVLKLIDISISKRGLVKGKKIIERLKQIVPEYNIEDLPIAFCAIATDIINETEAVFTSGNLFDAISASIAIPTVFLPKQINDNFYVDGGLLNPAPVDRVKRGGNDLLVIVDVSSHVPYVVDADKIETVIEKKHQRKIQNILSKSRQLIPEKRRHTSLGIFNLTNKSIGIMQCRISELVIERSKPDIVINLSKDAFGIFDFYKAAEIISYGEMVAKKTIDMYNAGRI